MRNIWGMKKYAAIFICSFNYELKKVECSEKALNSYFLKGLLQTPSSLTFTLLSPCILPFEVKCNIFFYYFII